MNTESTQYKCNHNILEVFNLVVKFDIGMGPDPPVSYSRRQGTLKFLMEKSLFPKALSWNN